MGLSPNLKLNPVRDGLICVTLMATFVSTCWAEPIGIYLALVAAIISLPLGFNRVALRAALADLGVWCLLAAFAVLSTAFILGAERPDDGMAFVDFLALPVIVPAYALLVQRSAGRNVVVIAILATLGCIVAIAVGYYEVRVRGMPRAAGGTSPIFFSDMAVLLGFFSLLGMLAWRSRWRWLFAVGHSLGLGAAIFGGTRGAMVAEIVLLTTFSLFTLFWWRRTWAMRTLTVLGVMALSVVFTFSLFDMSRPISILNTAGEVVSDGEAEDVSTNIRLKFWAAGFQSFLESPIYGHSWWNRFEAAVPYMPADIESEIKHNKTSHLHNDIVNFASGAGIMGVLAYLILMAAPVVSAWRSRRDEFWSIRLVAATGLTAGYVAMGLTDTMFVFEIPKSMFVLCSAVVMAFFLDAAPVTSESKVSAGA